MDAIDAPGPAAPAARAGSQSAVSPVLLWVLLAALVLRVVTAVMDRGGDGPGHIRWRDRASAKAEAARLNKPLLYDFTAAWCAPCKLLDRDWEDGDVAEQVNGAFVPVRVVDRIREDGQNAPDIAELQRLYEVSAFPTLVVAFPDGRLIAKHEGYRNRGALMSFLTGGAAGGTALR